MNRENVNGSIVSARLKAMMLVLLLGVVVAPNYALSADAPFGGSKANVVMGSFDGLELKTKQIWIGDKAYMLDSAVRVKGTSTKLGLMTDLKQGEIIKAYLRENEETPSVPYVTRIERQ